MEQDFNHLISIVKTLRSEEGCPWDREQTHVSLKKHLIEESYEVCEGIDLANETGDYSNLCEELGDLLFQVIIHSEIALEEGQFTIEDVVKGISKKMIRRHPHVFATTKRDIPMEKNYCQSSGIRLSKKRRITIVLSKV